MPDELRSPVKHHHALHRRDSEQGVARFYSLMIERDLFGRVVLVRCWGRIGTNGRELVEEFACEIETAQAIHAVAQAKSRTNITPRIDIRSSKALLLVALRIITSKDRPLHTK